MEVIAHVLISVAPVALYLFLLANLDVYRLLAVKDLTLALALGAVSAGSAFVLNQIALDFFASDYRTYAVSIGPVFEELLKTVCFLIFLLRTRVGFMIDGALLGFAIGAAFAGVENVVFAVGGAENAANIGVAVARGFGTALMHAGVGAVAAALTMYFVNKYDKAKIRYALPGFIIASALHIFFNFFYFSAINQAIIGIVAIPALFVLIFNIYSKKLSAWLGDEFDGEIDLLMKIKSGEFSQTAAGKYFLEIKDRFDAETVVDLYSYLVVSIELSIRAKSSLLISEFGMGAPRDAQIEAKLSELRHLRKSVGKTGLLALSAILPQSYKNLWKIERLKK